MKILKHLSELPGAPGREERVREYIQEQVEKHSDEISTDALGNLICFKKGTSKTPRRVMVACHMDEIAFYVRNIDEKGFIRVHHVGGFDTRNLFARRVRIQPRRGDDIFGNLNPSGRPIHVATPEERTKIPTTAEFFIDTGLSPEEIKKRIRPGDPVTLVQEFTEFGDLATGKCLDNRAACWVGIETLKRLKKNHDDVYIVFTVQEEIGIRGATTSSYAIDPDIGIAIDTTLAVDTPGVSEEEQITKLGAGVAIKIMDSYSISDNGLVDQFIELAEKNKIPHQMELLTMGGTDAAALQRARGGARAITLSIPTRYIHTVTETIHKKDLKATADLLIKFLETK